jgi:adenylate cyclase class IV
MTHVNIEIKAKSTDQNRVRDVLKSRNADFKGVDHQIDTYFNVNFGRLKLRE